MADSPYILRKGVSKLADLADGYNASWGPYSNSYPTGKVFYVNYGGNDSESGLDPEAPLLTLTQAIANCTSDKHDTIVVMNWWQNEACPIVVNKRMINIIGARGGSLAQPALWIQATGDTDAFTFSERDIHLENFWISGGATSYGVGFTAGAGFQRQGIYNCYFSASAYGIYGGAAANTPSHYLSVSGCYFQSMSTGGIYLGSNGSWPVLQNNVFDSSVAGPQINIAGAHAAGRIVDNIFALDSDSAGEAITLSASTARYIVMGNRAQDAGITAMTANPFVDGGTANHWYDNYRCNAVVLPGA